MVEPSAGSWAGAAAFLAAAFFVVRVAFVALAALRGGGGGGRSAGSGRRRPPWPRRVALGVVAFWWRPWPSWPPSCGCGSGAPVRSALGRGSMLAAAGAGPASTRSPPSGAAAVGAAGVVLGVLLVGGFVLGCHVGVLSVSTGGATPALPGPRSLVRGVGVVVTRVLVRRKSSSYSGVGSRDWRGTVSAAADLPVGGQWISHRRDSVYRADPAPAASPEVAPAARRSATARSADRMSSGRTAGVVCRTTIRIIAHPASPAGTASGTASRHARRVDHAHVERRPPGCRRSAARS